MRTFMTQPENRWQTIKSIWRDPNNRWLYALVGFICGALSTFFFTTESQTLSSLFPEAAGIFFTVVFIDALYRRNAEETEIRRLIRQMRSRHNYLALQALEQLGERVSTGAVRGKSFAFADLTGAYIADADCYKTNFFHTRLIGGTVSHSNCASANFEMCDLTASTLSRTNFANSCFRGATIIHANVDNCDFEEANFYNFNRNLPPETPIQVTFGSSRFDKCDFRHAWLRHSNFIFCSMKLADLEFADMKFTEGNIDFTDANLERVKFQAAYLPMSTLPDGSVWTEETDLERFTNPKHPDFWRSDNPDSPAYRGKTNH